MAGYSKTARFSTSLVLWGLPLQKLGFAKLPAVSDREDPLTGCNHGGLGRTVEGIEEKQRFDWFWGVLVNLERGGERTQIKLMQQFLVSPTYPCISVSSGDLLRRLPYLKFLEGSEELEIQPLNFCSER